MAAKRKINLAIKKSPEPAADSGSDAALSFRSSCARLDEADARRACGCETILAHKRGCCMSCNYPHVMGVCRRNCVCHEAPKYFEARGIKVDI